MPVYNLNSIYTIDLKNPIKKKLLRGSTCALCIRTSKNLESLEAYRLGEPSSCNSSK